MYVVTGVTGRTGAVAANALLKAGERVRVVVRDPARGAAWAARGAQVAVADLGDSKAFARALTGAWGAYLVSPPGYHLPDMFERAAAVADAVAQAVEAAQGPRLVLLSSIGAEQPQGTGVIATNHLTEQRLRQLGTPLTVLRASYFMENWAGAINSVLTQGILPSFLSPLHRRIPMVATQDIGEVAAQALCEQWAGSRTIALEGPARHSPSDIAAILTRVARRSVRAEAVEPSAWREVLGRMHLSCAAIAGFIEMNQALNSGLIAFGNDSDVIRVKGTTTFEAVAAKLLRQ